MAVSTVMDPFSGFRSKGPTYPPPFVISASSHRADTHTVQYIYLHTLDTIWLHHVRHPLLQ